MVSSAALSVDLEEFKYSTRVCLLGFRECTETCQGHVLAISMLLYRQVMMIKFLTLVVYVVVQVVSA